ncbi:MAG: addiction module protein [Cyanobium sp. D14.bin.5]|jgi:putative addiction module component (TIGR02574 family)|nr:addiction module protein [Cyanobium sp. D14.bin.5]
MGSTSLTDLLALPATERLELAMGLWQSLDHAEQEQALAVCPALITELERRWSRHQHRPEESLSWELVRQELGLE